MEIALGALAYFLPLMPFAYLWHMSWFKAQYTEWQYFSEHDAHVPLGFTSMVLQGVVLSVSYWFLVQYATGISPFVFACAVGVYHWTVHVVAAMAKQAATRTWGYFGLETVYLIGQFGMFAVLLNFIY
jgi:hypothetical protein